jgi:nucleotide-binding universal stress UspA family protein
MTRPPQIKRILFPVDFSDSSIGAARYVEAMAGHFEAEVMLLHAFTMGEHNLADELLPKRQAQLDRFLSSEFKYFTTRHTCVIADPESAIADAVRSWNPDLVMMATYGLGYFRRHFIGSVTAKALHDLRCPVWTSVHAEKAPALEALHCRRILCAVDCNKHSRSVLGWAAWLAGEYQAELGIVHAADKVEPTAFGLYFGEQFDQHALEHAKESVATLQAQAGTAVNAFIKPGDPDEVIAGAVGEFGADLLVIGRHEPARVSERQYAYSILRESPCPVINI